MSRDSKFLMQTEQYRIWSKFLKQEKSVTKMHDIHKQSFGYDILVPVYDVEN